MTTDNNNRYNSGDRQKFKEGYRQAFGNKKKEIHPGRYRWVNGKWVSGDKVKGTAKTSGNFKFLKKLKVPIEYIRDKADGTHETIQVR